MNAKPADQPAMSARAGSGRRTLPAWLALQKHAEQMRTTTLRSLFDDDSGRTDEFTIEDLGMYVDFAKNRVTSQTMQLLIKLADKCGLPGRIEAMFTGEKINVSEDRAVLHVALRAPRDATITVDGENVVTGVHEVLDRMADFATEVRSGVWLGHSGKRIRDIINIGIGGSDLGPRMAHQALRAFGDPALRVQFVSNIDGAEFVEATYGRDPAETLFIIKVGS